MNKFTQKAFMQFFYPSLIVGIGLAVSNVIDSVVVGNVLGEAGLAAIGYSIPIFMFTDAIFVSLSVGGSVTFVKLLGAGDNKAAEKIASIIAEVSALIGLLIAIVGVIFTPEIVVFLGASPANAEVYSLTVSYCRIIFFTMPAFFINCTLYYLIRSDNQEKFAGIAFFLGTIVDSVMNVVLVIFLNVGINGSAYATLIGQTVSIIFLLFHLTHRDRVISFKLFSIDWKEVLNCFKIGFSSSNEYISHFIFVLIANHILMHFSGASGVAVIDVVLNISYIASIFITASTDSLMPLAGTLFGERNFPELHKMLSFTLKTGMGLSTIYLSVLVILARPVCVLFGVVNPDTLALGMLATRIYCLAAWFQGYVLISESYYQATDRERATYIVTLLKGYVFMLIFTLLFAFTNEYIFWWSMPLTEFCALVVVQVIRKTKRFSSTLIVSPDRFYTAVFNHSLANLSEVMGHIEELCDSFNISPKQSMFIMNTLEEVCVIIRDNTPTDKADAFYIIVTVVFEADGQVRFCIRDNATAFNPFEHKADRITADNLDDFDVLSGLGIMMVKKKAKEFNYRRFLNFNTLIVII